MTPEIASLGRCAAVYFAAHPGDVDLSCPGRLLAERERGLRVLVVTVFASPQDPKLRENDLLILGMPDAPRRDAVYESPQPLLTRHAEDDPCLPEVVRLLDEIVRRAQPRHVYLPMGVGGHADRRIVHAAGLRVVTPQAGRDVFLYEERPHALVPGAVQLRLGELGARLPPAAQRVAREAGLARFLLRQQTLPRVRDPFRGWSERVQEAQLMARLWMEARGWRPQKALGLRLQPVLHAPTASLTELARHQVRAWVARVGASPKTADRLVALAGEYSRRLGGDGHVERYWLLLPAREEGGRAVVAAPTPVLTA